MDVTVVYVVGRGSDDDATLVYKDGKLVFDQSPSPNYGGQLELLVKKLTGVQSEILTVKQTGKKYPEDLDSIRKWPASR